MDNVLVKAKKDNINGLREMNVEPYAYSYDKKDCASDVLEKGNSLKTGESSSKNVKFAGRVVALRKMGKASFGHMKDFSGRVQFYIRMEDVGKKVYSVFRKIDVGDFIGLEGNVFKTKKGEITINVSKLDMLSKSLMPLPEKFHGLKDTEVRYRQRYLDLLMNDDVLERFKVRSKIISLIRKYLDSKNFIEIETPVLQVLYGGTNAKPFKTHINAYDMDMYLRIAPELYLKRAVVGGFERVYEIARNFRNEGVDQTHNPEFTMIEWYEAYADYNKVMDRAEELYKFIAKELLGGYKLEVGSKIVDLNKKWPRVSMKSSLKKYTEINIDALSDSDLKKLCSSNKVEIKGMGSRGQMIFELFDKIVTPKLINPVWIIDYPKEVSPLAKVHRKDDSLVERFECYVGGKEIGDGWTEIVNASEQRLRFENEQKALRAGDDEAHPMDEDFLKAMEYGMPPLGGIGVGIDRLVMLFTNKWAIRDVIMFPTMKPKD